MVFHSLSSQLYTKSTHFLLELIQNADDNTYTCTSPTLSFSYKPGSLRVDCNEEGFTAENVEAICSINKSTKSGKTSYGEYIGEKGIGFKSVFKIADVVWISSGEFTFKFDKAKCLGMVTPIWADFPEITRPGWTSMYLQLSKGHEEETLIHELLTFDTNVLIFLKQIEEINIRVIREGEAVWERRTRKSKSLQDEDQLAILHAGESTSRYLIRTHVIKDLPDERKRPNWPQSKVLLAFPTAEIRDAVAEAFLLSIEHFNRGHMKYTWPYFLPFTPTTAYSFFDVAAESILTQLRECRVLESCAGTMMEASSLKHVPLDLFADQEGIPFTMNQYTAASYLSLKYPAWVVEATRSIGVMELSPQEFLEDLNSAITQDPTAFRTRPLTWHSQLAETLRKLATEPELESLILDMCLIPLHDGNWTSARGQSMFFSKDESSLEIPSGIEVLILDPTAESDPIRKHLFTNLGVKEWEASEICNLVLKVHQSSNFDPTTLTRDQLISHAAFLYKASWQPPKTADLWFATTQDERCLGGKLYIPWCNEANSAAARIFSHLQKRFPVIHSDYVKVFPSDSNWPVWLVNNLGLSMVPRMITPQVDPQPQPTQVSNVNEKTVVDGGSNTNLSRKQDSDVLNDFDFDSFLHDDGKENGDCNKIELCRPTRMSAQMRFSIQRPKILICTIEQKNSADSKETYAKASSLEPGGDVSKIFDLSDEFTFIFRECHTRDVLQLLKDNWQHYSQWVDGAHMQWQTSEFCASSSRLKSRLGSCLVHTSSGVWPLQESVAPMLDPTLEGELIPAVQIKDPVNPQWALLSHFGVSTKLDIHYYLRCLVATSRHSFSDVNNITYIYEQIQNRYRGNEELICAAFHEKDIVLIQTRPQDFQVTLTWTNMRACISTSISVEEQYKSCSYLFRCLASPSRDPVASVIATVNSITSASKLDDISRFFRNVNTVLKDVNPSQITQLLTPLQSATICPIVDSFREQGFDRLLGIGDTSWFIADNPVIRTSFLGKLPLLALSIEEVHELDDLFRVLWLGKRMLSKIVSIQAHPKGLVTTDWNYTISMHQKTPFIKALVPHSHHDRRKILGQLDNIRVSITTEVSQTFSLNFKGTIIQGRSVAGQVSLSRSHNLFHLFMTEECAKAKTPPYDLLSLIADACSIRNPVHYSLLCTLLGNSDLEEIYSVFCHRGLYVPGIDFGRFFTFYFVVRSLPFKGKLQARVSRGGLLRIPRPRLTAFNDQGRSFRGMPDITFFTSGFGGGGGFPNHRDRRLPIAEDTSNHSLGEADVFGCFIREPDQLRGWGNLQHLGEHMVSKILRANLGQAYNPERHWTSKLRTRSGYSYPVTGLANTASFTISESETSELMTRFIIQQGQSKTPNWKQELQATSPVYYLDVVVSGRGRTSMFAISSSQIQRIRNLRMQYTALQPNRSIAVLVQVNDVYSAEESSVDIYVDPWFLLDSNSLTLEEEWLFRGAIHQVHPEPGKKRLRTERLTVPWRMSIDAGPSRNNGMTLRSSRNQGEYPYATLSSGNTRLLYLLPGDTGDQLHGVIVQVPHDGTETYSAVSYVWGTGRRTQTITTPDGVVRITASLASCLRHLRHKSEPALLWVDAICINQSDNEEKAQQVRMLATIFQRAVVVYGFVTSSKTSDAVVEMLMQVRAKAIGQEICITSIPQLTDAIWDAVGSFFADSWFRRAWIIQETVAAHRLRLVSGRWVVDWNDLSQAMEIVDREILVSGLDLSKLRSTWGPFMCLAAQREWEERNSRWCLLVLLENYRHARSTLARDRLFALLGLASDGNDAAFEPDYSSPLRDILLRFCRVFIRQGKGMQLLYRAGLTGNCFPSWIPDWTVERPSSISDYLNGGMPFSASGSQQPKMTCTPDSDELAVEGYAVDTIERVSEASNLEKEWRDYFREIEEMVKSLDLGLNSTLATELKWKVPIAGAEHPTVAVPGDLDMETSYKALQEFLVIRQDQSVEILSSAGKGNASDNVAIIRRSDANRLRERSSIYISALRDRVNGWRFIVTEKGYAGVAPPSVRKGDTVAILKGGCVPFILQESKDRQRAFRLVGECYINGIMDGQGLLLNGVLETVFCIF
ncbi:hypothetical protein DER44DRAFT_669606 [Fusarium oxysporum]|nr:hypothetical protein DER44DRAFT_669606 [Fusarium oxysporum]